MIQVASTHKRNLKEEEQRTKNKEEEEEEATLEKQKENKQEERLTQNSVCFFERRRCIGNPLLHYTNKHQMRREKEIPFF